MTPGRSDVYKADDPDGPVQWPEIRKELVNLADPYWSSYKDFPPRVPKHLERKRAAQARKLPWTTLDSPSEDQEFLDEFLEYLIDPETPHEKLYELYRRLPPPRPPLLSQESLDMLVARFMTVPERNVQSMIRYLSILDDMKLCGLPISRNEWNAAISLVSRAFHEVTATETKSALSLWEESERYAGGVPADTTTFNILLDMASKSPTPLLTDLILKEMQDRKIQPDRFTYTSLITYYGICGDANKVRETYRTLVDEGEIVDTVILNAVMTAFIRTKEFGAAEYIYRKMRRTLFEPGPVESPPAHDDWEGLRRWAKNLKHIARKRKIVEDYMRAFNVSLAPDIVTFNMLILVQCHLGNYARCMELLQEMEQCGVKYDDTISTALLKGFFWKGGSSTSDWTHQRLELVLERIFDQEKGQRMTRSLAVWVLRAVAKVYNSKLKVLMTWGTVAQKWRAEGAEPDVDVVNFVKGIVGIEAWTTWTSQKQKNPEKGA